MLFNSYVFIFVFLPVTLGAYYLLRHAKLTRQALLFLVGASFAYYAWWNFKYVFLLVALMMVNYLIALEISISRQQKPQHAKRALAVGLLLNLTALGYYKYMNFFVDNVNLLFGSHYALAHIVLPLGISFFTFQKIAFLVDAYQGKVKTFNPLSYALFVVFFPQLIAGPIVHHSEMIPQFNRPAKLSFQTFLQAMTIFVIGLAKKTLIADNVARFATPHFDAVAAGAHLDFGAAWGAALAYTAQIYFDFSAYSDMAIGLGLLFGVKLPLNFNSPYKSKNIIEFWRRWHMTLSRFLRDYLYIPLGGNRKGTVRRYINLAITMLLGGIWHGAGWTFLIWGALHGFYLMVNHAWHAISRALFREPLPGQWLLSVAGWVITFPCVVIAWVFFRAANFKTAGDILHSMFHVHGIAPAGFGADVWVPLLVLMMAFILPNTQQLTCYAPYVPQDPDMPEAPPAPQGRQWQPTWLWAVYTGILFALSLMSLTQISEFIYFQF